MVKDAEAHAADDKKRRELVEARNQADSLIHSTEKNLKEHGDKIDAADQQRDRNRRDGTSRRDGRRGCRAIKQKTQNLTQLAMKLGEAVYKAQQQAEAPGAARRRRFRRCRASRRTRTASSMPTSRRSTRTARTSRPDRSTGERSGRGPLRLSPPLPAAATADDEALTWPSGTITKHSASSATRRTTRSRKPTASSRCSFTRTAIRAMPRPSRSSRTSTKPTTS